MKPLDEKLLISSVQLVFDYIQLCFGTSNRSVASGSANVYDEILLVSAQPCKRRVHLSEHCRLNDFLESHGVRAQVAPETFVVVRIFKLRAVDNNDVAVFDEIWIVFLERLQERLFCLWIPIEV